MILQTDVKGKIPKLIFNKVSMSVPGMWLKNLLEGYKKLKEKKIMIKENFLLSNVLKTASSPLKKPPQEEELVDQALDDSKTNLLNNEVYEAEKKNFEVNEGMSLNKQNDFEAIPNESENESKVTTTQVILGESELSTESHLSDTKKEEEKEDVGDNQEEMPFGGDKVESKIYSTEDGNECLNNENMREVESEPLVEQKEVDENIQKD
jgi:hypothetical protein